MKLVLKDILKGELDRRGMGVPTLAKRTGISRQTISNWVEGQKPQNIEQVKVVAMYLEMTVDELCFGHKVNPASSMIEVHKDEINAGVFEVVLRRIRS